MTLASDLSHVVCPTAAPSGVAHDPSFPLVLGDTNSSKYVVMTFDASSNRWQAQVVGPGGVSAIYSFDQTGHIYINNVDIGNNPQLTTLVQQAKDAAAASAASANAAATSADLANTRAAAAGSSATQSGNSASLAEQYANAPAGTTLPDGGNSCAVSVQQANAIAQATRDLVIGGTVTADETYQSGYVNTERQVTATGLVTITIPPNIFSSASALQRWGSYRLCNGTGSIRFVGAAGAPNLQTPILQTNAPRTLYRHSNSTSAPPVTVASTITLPAITAGKIYAIIYQVCRDNTTALTSALSSDRGLSWTKLQAFPALANGTLNYVYEVQAADLTSLAAGDINVSVDLNSNNHQAGIQLFAVQDNGSAGTVVGSTNGNAAGSAFTAALTSVVALSRVVAFSLQGEITANSQFANWSTNITNIASGNTNGLPDTAATNGDKTKNSQWAFGSGVQNVDGAFNAVANYTAATGKGLIVAVAIAPKSVAGAGGVTMEYEGGRDTMTVPYGVAELWFVNNGTTVRVRTPKP